MEWYVIRSKPHKEAALHKQLKAHGIETYYPQIRVKPVNPRSRTWRPFFPGYLFVHVDLEELGFSTLAWMPHSHGLVQFGGEPASVPENLVHEMRRRLDALNAAGGEKPGVLRDVKHGDVVEIREGPLEGYEAVFDEQLTPDGRVRVLIGALEQQHAVNLEARSLRKKRDEGAEAQRKK